MAVKSTEWKVKGKEKENLSVSYTVGKEWLTTQNLILLTILCDHNKVIAFGIKEHSDFKVALNSLRPTPSLY